MPTGNYGLDWPAAKKLALAGEYVRQQSWADRWLYCVAGIWWTQIISTGETWVVRGTAEFGRAAYRGIDWTTLWPDQEACVVPVPPTVKLVASPSRIARGGSSVLSWEVTGAATASLDGADVPLYGNRTVTPAESTIYTLSAPWAGPDPVIAQASVGVDEPATSPPPAPAPPAVVPNPLKLDYSTGDGETGPTRFPTRLDDTFWGERTVLNPFAAACRVHITGRVDDNLAIAIGSSPRTLVASAIGPQAVDFTFILGAGQTFTVWAVDQFGGGAGYDLWAAFDPS